MNWLLFLVSSVILGLACGDNITGMDGISPGADSGQLLADATPTVDLADATLAAADATSTDTMPDAGSGAIELACTLEDVQPLIECVTDNCLESLSDGTLTTCLALSCGLLFLTMPPDCTQCILAGLTDPASALEVCVSGLDTGGTPMLF